MAHKKYDLAVKTGSYERNGESKNRYMNIGAVFQGENGPYIVLNRAFNPAGVPFKEGSDSIIVSCFEPRDPDGNGGGQRQQRPAQQQRPEQQRGGYDDESVPF